jgi:hypothetical protein
VAFICGHSNNSLGSTNGGVFVDELNIIFSRTVLQGVS